MKEITFGAKLTPTGLSITIEGDYNTNQLMRSEGAILMDLERSTFELDGIDCSATHPDIIALTAVLAFHPAIPTERFILRVTEGSPNLPAALNLPHILPHAEIVIEREVPAYEAHREAVLSFGGGFDSLAAHTLFPDLPLIHESPLPDKGIEYDDVVNRLVREVSDNSYIARDNLRVLFTKWGLPLWMSVYIPSLLLQPRYIVSGSEMTGTYLLGGKKYHPRYANRWYDVFRAIGVSILPTSFLSEIGNGRVVYGSDLGDKAAYCALIRNQDCGRCTKCLRRRAIRALIEESSLPLSSFRSAPEIDAFLANRPLYYGDIFTHAVNGAPRTWLTDHLRDLSTAHPDLSFHERYYPRTFDHFAFPSRYRALAEQRLAELGIEPFTADDEATFVNFQQVANPALN